MKMLTESPVTPHAADTVFPDYERLAVFLAQARPLLQAQPGPDESAEAIVPDLARMKAFLPKLNCLLQKARERGDDLNPWTLSGMAHYEVPNVRVLAAFWNPRLCGERGREFLSVFLQQIRKKNEGKENYLPSKDQLERGYVIQAEKYIDSEKKNERIDLLIEGDDFILGIEAKVMSREGSEQYERYHKRLQELREKKYKENKKDKKTGLLILDRYARPAGYLHATWADVKNAGRKFILLNNTHDFHTELLEKFLLHIRNF